MRHATDLRQFSRSFRAMGTEVQFWLWNNHEQRAQQALAAGEHFFARTEARLSRFHADSELSRCNRAAGQPFAASNVLFELVASALAWRDQTDGIFDPAVLNSLIAYGYDRSFNAIAQGSGQPTEAAGQRRTQVQPVDSSGIRLGPGQCILLPAGVGLDLGGIAKGWTIQQVADRLGMWGPCLVDAGGDIACRGTPPTEPWVVTVANPADAQENIAVLTLDNEAVATSSRVRRQWRHEGQAAHHLIDPRSGAPAETNLLSVTVVAPRLPDAEIYAKCALILGEEHGLAWLSEHPQVAALLVTEDGRHLISGRLEEKAYVSSRSFIERFERQAEPARRFR
jgi:thiamine biosynthesis lipoprotein